MKACTTHFVLTITTLVMMAAMPAAACAAPQSDADDNTESSASDVSANGPVPLPTGTVSTKSELAARYAPLATQKDSVLKNSIFALVKDHHALGYDGARGVLLRKPALGTTQLECVYTGRVVSPDGTNTPSGFNTEHSWPQSMGASTEPARSDLHHIFPVDEKANSARNNYLYGTVTCLHPAAGATAVACSYENGGSALGKTVDNDFAFEVRHEMRGDVARAQFYFSIRYSLPIAADVEASLREWNDEDPVDTSERTKNDAIETYQNNRNPFVDHPEFAKQISDF